MWHTVLFCLLLVVKDSVQYSTGADPSACLNMMPGHGQSAQTGVSPYTLLISSAQYTPGGTLTVTISGSVSFKGFLIRASQAGFDISVGSFAAVGSTQAACAASGLPWAGLTHTTSLATKSLTLTWSAPSTAQGYLYFYLTVVQSLNTYWVKQQFGPIWDGVSSTVATSSALSVQATTALPTTTATPATTASTTNCGVTKSCFASPTGCTGSNCDYLLTWQAATLPSVNVAIQFALQVKSTGYASVAFSKSTSMTQDTIVNCISTGTGVTVSQTFSSTATTPHPISSSSSLINVVNATASIDSTYIKCSFIWNNDASARISSSQLFDLSNTYHVLMARGQASGGYMAQHTDTPVVLSQMIAATSTQYVNYSAGVSTGTWLAKIHGAIMVVAWMFCATTGLLMARYYKKKWLDTKLCGEKIWFAWHRGLMVACLLLTVVAFIIIYIKVKDWSSTRGLPADAHPYLGVIVTALAIANPIMAQFRGNPGTKKRNIFNWAHWAVGNLALILAATTVLIGLQIDSTVTPTWLVYVGAAYVVFFGLVYLEMMREEYFTARAQADAPPPHEKDVMAMTSAAESAEQTSGRQYSQDTYKSIMFGLFMVVNIAFTVTLVVAILASS